MNPADDSRKASIKLITTKILRDNGPLDAARYLAQYLFRGVKEINGTPYFGHLTRVAAGIADEKIKPAGYLHDLVEDILGWDFKDLEDIGFDKFIIDAVRAVTKDDSAPYFDEMVRVSLTPQAIPLKKSDLEDNSNLLRLPRVPQPHDIERSRKYYLSWHYLNDVESGQTSPGTPFATWMRSQPEEKQDWGLLHKYTASNDSNSRNPPNFRPQ